MKKKLLVVSLLCAFVMTFAMMAVGCGGGISRGGGSGQNVDGEASWRGVITATQLQEARNDRNWTMTRETRDQVRIDGNNRSESHLVQRTIRNGDNVQRGNEFWRLYDTQGTGNARRYERIYLCEQGYNRLSQWTSPPRVNISTLVNSWINTFGYEFFEFRGGRMVLNTDRLIAAEREEWDEELEGEPFPEPHRRDRLRIEITVVDGIITNAFMSSRQGATGAINEERRTVEWDRASSIRIPNTTPYPWQD
ncbi:MAG: hypothetical protein FWC80_00565 [Firmicutes bacterium]|nr:hypothetical protein [Bacillota bacterium]